MAKKLNQPVYVGCSMNLAGVTVEEEMEGLRDVVERVTKVVNGSKRDQAG